MTSHSRGCQKQEFGHDLYDNNMEFRRSMQELGQLIPDMEARVSSRAGWLRFRGPAEAARIPNSPDADSVYAHTLASNAPSTTRPAPSQVRRAGRSRASSKPMRIEPSRSVATGPAGAR